MSSIAVLGLGAMGARMAARLLDAGHAVSVYNRTPGRADALAARGARVAATPAEAAAGADVALAMVRDNDASEAVWLGPDGALAALAAGSIAVESSTLTPGWVRRLAELADARSVRFLDAPVVGSRPHAEAGGLTFLVGGAPEALDAAADVLGVLGGTVHAVGPPGAGATMKLMVNALFAVQAAALAEALGVLSRAGVAPTEAAPVLAALPTASPAAARLGRLMASGDIAPNFPVALVAKDLRYADEVARTLGAALPQARAAWAAFEQADAAGFGGDDIAGVAQLYLG